MKRATICSGAAPWPVRRGWSRSSSPRSRRERRRSGRIIWIEACGGDDALRLQVERLLDAHPQAEDFLARPAVDREQFDSDAAADDRTSLAPPSGQERSPRDHRARSELNETLDQERGDDVEMRPELLAALGAARLAGPAGALRGAGGPGQRRLRDRGEGVRREAASVRRHQAHVPAPGRDLGRRASGSCAKRGRPRPSATRMWSPSTPSRTSRSPIWSWSTSPDEPCSRSSTRPVRWS